jgi:hypothetical protein
MEDLRTMLEAASTGNEAPTTPEPTPQPGNDVTPLDTPQVPTPEDDTPQSIRDYLSQNPDHRAVVDLVNREMKAAFTPKLQEAAELRKQLEGLDPNTLQAIRYLDELSRTNPTAAANYLRQQAEALAGSQSPEPSHADPYAAYEPATDVEAFALQKIREMDAWKQQLEQTQERQRLEAQAVQARSDFEKFESQYGIQMDWNQKAMVWDQAMKSGMGVSDILFLRHKDAILQREIQRARDEASSVVQQKASAFGVPGNITPRVPDGGPQLKSIGDFIRHELNSNR